MNFVFGLALIALAAGMMLASRPAKGMETAPFLNVWIVGPDLHHSHDNLLGRWHHPDNSKSTGLTKRR
jgi:hypothetical protein